MTSITLEQARSANLPLIWRDKGLVHACDGDRVHPDVVLLWTLCGLDVPASAAEAEHVAVTCPACLRVGG